MFKSWEGKISNNDVIIYTLRALEDNFIYVISWEKKAVVIDPGEAGPVMKLASQESLEIDWILLTHEHDDHIAGAKEVKDSYTAKVVASTDAIQGVGQIVQDDDELIIGPLLIKVMATPGHIASHVSFYLPEPKILFSGDCIFGGGCGKLLDHAAQQMFTSLQKCAKLPKDTLIFFGHEYTQKNLEFALTIDPDNKILQKRLADTKTLYQSNQISTPSTLEIELATNPFLRVNDPSIRKNLHMEDASDLEVFTKIRQMKDNY